MDANQTTAAAGGGKQIDLNEADNDEGARAHRCNLPACSHGHGRFKIVKDRLVEQLRRQPCRSQRDGVQLPGPRIVAND